MEAGKHVIIEKPVATTSADADRLLEIRDRTGRVAAVDFMMRFTPIVEAIASWKHELPFGRLRRVVIENHAQDETISAGHWFWDTTRAEESSSSMRFTSLISSNPSPVLSR